MKPSTSRCRPKAAADRENGPATPRAQPTRGAMTVPALRGANLCALLRPIAAEARKRCQARRARLGGAASECANAKDFVALSESWAFEAHRTFVRQLRIPFNWRTHRKAVVERARAM